MRWYALIAVGLTTACAAAGGWTKEDATKAQVRADLAECRSFAQEVTARDRRVDQDIQAGRRDSPVPIASALRDDVRDIGAPQRSTDLVSRCMRSHGYVRGRLPSEDSSAS